MAVDVKIIPPCFTTSIQEAFRIQVSTNAKVKNITMDQAVIKNYSLECMSTMSIKAAGYVGSLCLGFSSSTYLAILEKLWGEKVAAVTPENADASSELLNIIFASARKNINEQGFSFEPALPTTVVGNNLSLAKANLQGHTLCFECESEIGNFLLLLSLKAVPIRT